MKNLILFISLFNFSFGYSQSLPIDFESGVTTSNFVDFDGGVAMVIPNPQSNGINTSAQVAQIVRSGGEIWGGSKITLASTIDFSSLSIIKMKVFMSAPTGTTVKFKLEGNGATERDAITTKTNEWEELSWDFTGTPMDFTDLVFMFDFGNVGDGSANSTFLFDDVVQIFGGTQIDLPVFFEGTTINYTMTDFGGNVSSLVVDPTDPANHVIQATKTDQAAEWAGTTIGTPAGFASNIALTLTDSKMTVKVWSPDANTPIRLKVENSNDPTQTCETQTNTTLAGEWEVIEFDFTNEAMGTAKLSDGLNMGWTYNMASIFFNFGTEGSAAGEKTYYFDNVQFGDLTISTNDIATEPISIYPNPAKQYWNISSGTNPINVLEIYDLNARLLSVHIPQSLTTKVDASALETGIYLIRIYTLSGTKLFKVIKE